MKSEFLELINTDFDEIYISKFKPPYQNLIIEAFESEELTQRELLLKERFSALEIFDFKQFANPFYIGFGNPNSEILVIGKEKAFSSENFELLIKESINNYKQWKTIIQNDLFKMNQLDVTSKIGFSPLLPKSYHTGKTKRNHTWSITASIINQIYPAKELQVNEIQDITKSFFQQCFLTELNYKPAKYHEGSGLSLERMDFLKSNFFKSFPSVIFSAKSYLKGDDKIIKEIFNAKFDCVIELDKIGRDKTKPLTIEKYTSEYQTIYVCNQLSGASGWTNNSLTKFAEQISIDSVKSTTNIKAI
ncbi:hypothetical protein LX69_03518 [Breznakibacter xylanolyticus]|uniref:Uncharacterized protein n=1 Tax=Breznakibacter xylanolyticus TaxID=990 RepID=A0A2W7MNA3_9BACT|nr:hypothetical protein [Breznakibacter xylanolyticus]PZX09795.1 hypothetical protein LX69_03518 [Breznakibacter xylanolyticus]